MSHKEEEFFTIKEIAEKLQVHHNTVRALIRTERLLAIRVGHQWRILSSDLEDYIHRSKTYRNGVRKVVPITGPNHTSQAIFGDDADHNDPFS